MKLASDGEGRTEEEDGTASGQAGVRARACAYSVHTYDGGGGMGAHWLHWPAHTLKRRARASIFCAEEKTPFPRSAVSCVYEIRAIFPRLSS